MAYDYQAERPRIFTEDGMNLLLKIRDQMRELCKKSGAVRFGNLSYTGDSWMALVCADYLVERGNIMQVSGQTAGQDRVFRWEREL